MAPHLVVTFNFLRQRLSLKVQLVSLARLTGQQAQWITHLCFCSEDYRPSPYTWLFPWALGIQNQGLMLAQQVIY